MKFLLYTLPLTLLTTAACCNSQCEKETEHTEHEKHSEHHHTNHNKSNVHMNKADFETLVDRFDNPERDSWQLPNDVIAKFGSLEGKQIADLGSGTGYFSFKLAEQGASVIAIDVDERFINYIEDKKKENDISNVSTRLIGFDDPEIAENEVDAIITVNTYHHFENKVEYMKKCLSGLKDGGTLMIVDFKKKETQHGPPEDHRIATEDIMKDLKSAGFTDITVDSELLEEQNVIMAVK